MGTGDPIFRSPNSVAMKVNNLRASHPSHTGKGLRTSKTERSIVEDFVNHREAMKEAARHIRLRYSDNSFEGAADAEATVLDEDLVSAAVEGGARQVLSIRRERDPKLRQAKIAAHLRDGHTLSCEICSFNYHESYGPRGLGYIEVHHKVPLHVSGTTTTKMSDLILVCASCHRMLHRGKWIAPEKLIQQIKSRE